MVYSSDGSHLPALSDRSYFERGMQRAQILLEFPDFRRLRHLANSLSITQLLGHEAKFIYKYLSPYVANSFTRKMRLAAILTHYQFLVARVAPAFFTAVARQPVLWQQQVGEALFTITLSYPLRSGYEGELSLNFCLNSTILQVVSFLIVPGGLVGSTDAQALLISQVQGTRHAALLKHATKTLHDITPAVLLVNAAYGLATALGIRQAIGISLEEQLCHTRSYFDYNGFWQQFDGQLTTNQMYLLDIPAPEKPIEQVKSKHRARTLRKRHYRQQLRAAVAAHFAAEFLAI